MEEDFTLEALEKAEREVEEINRRMEQREAQGLFDIYKYFDRINDKLSSFNNMLVACYLALIAIGQDISKWVLVLPILNMCVLVYVDYRMMEQGRILSKITSASQKEIDKYGRRQNQVTSWSLFTIITTIIVTVYFLIVVNQYLTNR